MIAFSVDYFQLLNHVDFYLKQWFLIKGCYYIVPSPSTALVVGKHIQLRTTATEFLALGMLSI